MAFDYNKYMRGYIKNKIITKSMKFHVEHDKDLIEELNKADNFSRRVKELMRKGIAAEK